MWFILNYNISPCEILLSIHEFGADTSVNIVVTFTADVNLQISHLIGSIKDLISLEASPVAGTVEAKT